MNGRWYLTGPWLVVLFVAACGSPEPEPAAPADDEELPMPDLDEAPLEAPPVEGVVPGSGEKVSRPPVVSDPL